MYEEYSIQEPLSWVERTSEEELLANLVETSFSESKIEEGKDFCYLLKKVFHTSDQDNSDYLLMAYTLNQPDNLKTASVFDQILEEKEKYLIHRIAVYRNGQIIDKLPDTTFKVMDNEDQSGGGVINSSRKVNVTIKDLRLYDILIVEETRTKEFTEKDLLRKCFYRNIFVTPNVYWAYGIYDIKLVNDRTKPIQYKKSYFRDDEGNLLEPEIGEIASRETFHVEWKEYCNPVDPKREVYPYFDFATQADWKSLSSFITPYYEEVFHQSQLRNFASDFVAQLDAISDKEDQIAFAIEYVQNQIRYIYNANEMHGHIPQDPKVTFVNKQGDCKAKSALLKVILDYLEIPSEVILVNFQCDVYMQDYLPSLLAFNHVILKISHQGETYFTDATAIDEYGRLDKRDFMSFLYYLPIREDQDLQKRPAFRFKDYCIDEHIYIDVKNGSAQVKIDSKYRYNRANNMRRYFKNTNKREIIDSWNNFLYYALNYCNDRSNEDIRNIFKDVHVGIVHDDKKANEMDVQYTAQIDKAYFTDKEGNRYLMFFDGNILKNARDYNHKDFPFWHYFDSEKYQIDIHTDESIDTKERYTVRELNVQHKYLDYSIKKDIRKNGGSAYIEYRPLSNLEIAKEEMEDLKDQYARIADSCHGLGVDIVEKGLLNKLKFGLKKMLK